MAAAIMERTGMDFGYSDKVRKLQVRLQDFMAEHIYPNELRYFSEMEDAGPWGHAPVIDELKPIARAAGLWNLFLPEEFGGPGLKNAEYAPLCEIMGRSLMAPEVFNCSAPDTGNMETIARYGAPEQKRQWLEPLLDGVIRSAFAMTEPLTASSDATNIESTITPDGDHYLINGRKWFTTGATDPRCKIMIFMGKTPTESEDRHRQQSMILVPTATPGVEILRPLPIFGFNGTLDKATEVAFDNVRVPATNMLLGPGRGRPLAEQTVTMERIAESRILIEQARLLTLKAAWAMDQGGAKQARLEIGMIKVAAPNMACKVIDWALQAFGGAGVTNDFGLAAGYAVARFLRIADGPDEVHRNQIAKLEMRRHAQTDPAHTGGAADVVSRETATALGHEARRRYVTKI
jgi:acyl-CoA dehydrogenase